MRWEAPCSGAACPVAPPSRATVINPLPRAFRHGAVHSDGADRRESGFYERCRRWPEGGHRSGREHATQAWSAHTSTHEHWHIHCSSRTPRSLAYTQHPDRASTHIAIAFTRHPTVTTPTTIQLTPPKHTSHTHEQTEGRQKACAVVPSLSDALADCATVATPFLGGKICHVHRPPRCEHASV